MCVCVCEIKSEINKTHNIPFSFLFFFTGEGGGGALVVFRGQFTAGQMSGRNFSRTELRALQTTKMELFLTIFNCQKSSTFITNSFI